MSASASSSSAAAASEQAQQQQWQSGVVYRGLINAVEDQVVEAMEGMLLASVQTQIRKKHHQAARRGEVGLTEKMRHMDHTAACFGIVISCSNAAGETQLR
jgi:hypothetical protein